PRAESRASRRRHARCPQRSKRRLRRGGRWEQREGSSVSGTDGHGRGYTARNRASWDASAEDYQATHGAALRQDGGLAWGVWRIPETTLRVLPPVDGLDVLELGCGAAQWSIGLARLGARAVGLDLSGR